MKLLTQVTRTNDNDSSLVISNIETRVSLDVQNKVEKKLTFCIMKISYTAQTAITVMPCSLHNMAAVIVNEHSIRYFQPETNIYKIFKTYFPFGRRTKQPNKRNNEATKVEMH